MATTTHHGSNAITADQRVGELVRERSARARVFERHGIDYCCQGGRTLADAAQGAGLDVAELASELAESEATDDDVTSQMPADALARHIVAAHHAYLREELPALEALADKVASVHGARHPELAGVAALVRAVRDDMEPHLDDEEDNVFPEIHRAVAEGAAVGSDALQRLRDDHEAVGALLAELRRASADFVVPPDGCASYQALYGRLADLEADTFRHIHLENNVLFPLLDG